MKFKFVSGLIQIASLRFIEALKGSKITYCVLLISLSVLISVRYGTVSYRVNLPYFVLVNESSQKLNRIT